MVNTIFILDKNLKTYKVLTINGRNSFFDDIYIRDNDTSTESFEFSTNIEDISESDYVMFLYHNEYKLFQIIDIEQEHNEGKMVATIYGESASLELLNSVVRAFNGEWDCLSFFNHILEETEWEIGYFSDELKTKVVNVNLDKTTQIWKCIQDYMQEYNYEINTRVEYNNGHVKKKILDVYAEGELGLRTYKRFEYGLNISGINKKKDLYDWCTALIVESKNSIVDIVVDEDGYFKTTGSDVILAINENNRYNNGKDYIYSVYEGNEMSAQETIDNALKELKKRATPHFDYEVTTALTYEEYMELNLGDTVRVVDHAYNPALLLEARVSKLELSFTDRNSCKCTLSNYKELKSNIMFGIGDKELTQADILAIKQYLSSLDISKEEVDKILKMLLAELDDPVDIPDKPKPGDDPDNPDEPIEDTENYKTIKLSTIDGGLWLGDKRIYDLKNNKTPTKDPSDNDKQYKDALEYYEKFKLGTKKNDAGLLAVMSDNNKYKIPTIVRYWCKKFGLDTRLVYAMIYQESSGNPYLDEAAYGLMQCEKSCYFGRKYTIKFLDGSTKSFTPSYSTMRPGSQGKTTINGVTVDKAISNQIMFGCHELRQRAENFHFNIFATLIGYNFGKAGCDWCICEYIKDKYGLTVNSNKRGIGHQSTKVKAKYYDILDTHKAPFASYRQKYKNRWGAGTPTNIELYLRYYKPNKGSLPYFKDKNGKKIGYGVNTPNASDMSILTSYEATSTAADIRDTIVKMAKTIVSQHVDQKIATYNQVPRTVNFDKPVHYRGTRSSFKSVKSNPIVYDCSSFASCCYLKAGLKSVYDKGCKAGSLVESATSKSGYKIWKCDANGIKDAKPGDLIMGCNYKVTTSNCTRNNWTGWARTHHVMVYIGDGKIAHARGWKAHPNAISINNLTAMDDYKNGRMFFLRPWDLAEADKKTPTKEKPKDNVSKITLKGLPNAKTSDYVDLPNKLTIGDKTDKVKFPTTTKYVYCHFGVGDLDTNSYISLLKALQNKYKKKPIFVAKEYHVNSSYANAAEVNAKIDAFNLTMQNYCNKTKYVIFLDISKGLVDDSGALLSTLSSDGYSFKDDASEKKYYDNVKKYILNISKGQIIESSSTDVTVTLLTQKIHSYSKPVKKLTVKLPSKPDDNFYSRLIFSTDANSIKFTQSDKLYLSGDNCKNGAFTPKKANKYIINVFVSTDNDITTKTYYGSVTSMYTSKTVRKEGQVNTPGTTLNVRKGSSTKYAILGELKDNTKITIISTTSNNWHKIKYKDGYGYVSGQYVDNIKDVTDTTTNFTNYANFKYRDTLVANAESFYKNKDKFTYSNVTPFNFSNPKDNIGVWKLGEKITLDDKFLMQLLTMGYSYSTMDIENKTNRNKAKDVSWALPYISNEAKLAKYFVENGWILDDVDYTNFSNVEPGDILFWDSDDELLDRFMACSHTSICVGKDANGNNMIIEGNTDGVIRKIKITDRNINNLLFVGRIDLSKK